MAKQNKTITQQARIRRGCRQQHRDAHAARSQRGTVTEISQRLLVERAPEKQKMLGDWYFWARQGPLWP